MENGESGSEKSGGALRWLLIGGLVIALGLAGYFFNGYQQRGKEMALRSAADSVRIADLDSKYTETLSMLNSYKGLNAQLDSIIKVRESELSECRNNFLAAVRKNNVNEEEYQKQLAELQDINAEFQNNITRLQAENKLLKIARDSLGRLVLVQNDSLMMLNDSIDFLYEKYQLGSILRPANITVTSTRSKKNNKDADTKKSSKVDQLKICFDVPANNVASADTQTFYIRILDPEGQTLSGSTPKAFISATTGDEIPYSIAGRIQYKNAPMHTCVYFRADVTYLPGSYTVEIYHKGYPAGTQTFELK
jgi:hypothetical protein